jgi:hypothetical protein
VRRIDPAGIITTVAGTGTCGYAGDAGPATAAQLDRVSGLATDGAGNLYITDRNFANAGNTRVRRVDAAGVITTVYTGRLDDGAIAVDPAGALHIATGCSVRRIDPATGANTAVVGITGYETDPATTTCGFAGDGGPPTSARLDGPNGPKSLAFAGGALYIGDGGYNRRIRRVGLPPVPNVSAVEPSQGPVAGGTAVAISGTGLSGATGVRFGSAPATSFKVDSDTRITATSPPGTGSVDVVVTTPGGTSAATPAARFTYLTRTYQGRATAVAATVGGTTTPVGDTGALDARGGAKEASVASTSLANLGSAAVGHATTVGQGDATNSEASLADLNLTVGTTTVTASFAMANAAATCSSTGPTLAASSQVADLVVNGKAVAVSGKANQVVALPVGQLVLNEQTTTDGVIAVNALHLVVPGQADVALASASAGITCAGSPECTAAGDRITGGGWIAVGGAKANFGVAGGTTSEGLWGHLTYQDKGTNVSVKGTGVSAYTVTGPTSRRIEGSADIGGTAGTYVVDVAENSASPDTFAIRLSSGYSASGSLGGGNITLHLRGPCP